MRPIWRVPTQVPSLCPGGPALWQAPCGTLLPVVPEDDQGPSDEESFTPPYISFQTLENTLDRMHGEGIPSRVDRSYLSSWSGSAQAQFLRAARSIGLLDADGHPTERLLDLVEKQSVRPELIREMVRQYYGDALALGENATQAQLEEVFRSYPGISGSTVRKAVAFYMHAARAGGIRLSPHFKAVRNGSSTASPSGTKRASRARRRSSTASAAATVAPAAAQPSSTGDARQRYIDLLLKKADENMDEALLDRIERVLAIDDTKTKPE